MIVRPLATRDLNDVVARVRHRLEHDARRNPMLNPQFSSDHFFDALSRARSQTLVAEEHGRIVGHLHGALLESDRFAKSAWVSPDGVSFDSTQVLAELYAARGSAWIRDGALDHYAWVFDHDDDVTPWYELGFARVHVRGVLRLNERPHRPPVEGYELRRGGPADLQLAIDLDHVLDKAQRQGPSFLLLAEDGARVDELRETLEDDEVRYYVLEFRGRGVAQCFTFPLESRRGSFDHSVHLSGVVVHPDHEHRGVAQTLVNHALQDAFDAGFTHAEVNWRVTNRRAAAFWVRYGFVPTYVRLHRRIEAN